MPTKNMNDGNLIERVNALEKEFRNLQRQHEMLVLQKTHDCSVLQEHAAKLLWVNGWIERHTDDCK